MKIPENFSESFLILDDFFTKTDVKIARSFLHFFKKRILHLHKESYPCLKTIAEMSKCSLKSVNNFLRKYEGFLIFRDSGRKRYNSPNFYEFNQQFFEDMVLLEQTGYLRNWTKKTRIHVMRKFYDNEWFLHEILYGKGELMNNDFAHSFWQKLRTIKNFFLQRISKDKVLNKVPVNKPTEERGFGVKDEGYRILQGLPLNDQQKKGLIRQFGTQHLRNGREAFFFKNGDSGRIDNPGSFIFMACRQSILNTMERK